jgi:hypothetical protein
VFLHAVELVKVGAGFVELVRKAGVLNAVVAMFHHVTNEELDLAF